MLDKKFDPYKFLFSGLITTIIGLALILFKKEFLLPLLEYTSYYLIIKGLIQTILNTIKKKFRLSSINTFLLGNLLFYYTKVPYNLIIIYELYLGIFFIIKIFSFILYTKNKVPGNIKTLLIGLIYLTIMSIIIISPNNYEYLSIFIGLIATLYGLKNIFFSLSQILPKNARKYLKFANRFPIPDIVAIFYPTVLTNKIYNLIKNNDTGDFLSDNKKSDLQIYLHLSPRGLESLGYMELAFNGKIISYANYDRHSRHLFEIIGDGVVLEANQEKYVNYHVNMRDRYLVEFGIKLDEKEKKIISNKIKELLENNNQEYYSDKQRALRKEIPDREFHDMSSEIYMYADGIFKKYTSGINKVFSIPRNNCVYFMHQILSDIGLKMYSINGFMSPGAYYDYFNHLYRLNYTNVVSRRIYIKGSEFNARITRSRNSKKGLKKTSTRKNNK